MCWCHFAAESDVQLGSFRPSGHTVGYSARQAAFTGLALETWQRQCGWKERKCSPETYETFSSSWPYYFEAAQLIMLTWHKWRSICWHEDCKKTLIVIKQVNSKFHQIFQGDHKPVNPGNLEYSGISTNVENFGNSVQPQGKFLTNKIVSVRSNICINTTRL